MSDLEFTPKLADALSRAQVQMSNPAFDRENPHFRNRFASLAAVRNAVIPVLAQHGIACIQDLYSEGDSVACVTVLMHVSGERFSSRPLLMPNAKKDAQGLGSAATYARRYQLMSVAGVVGDDDDDANAAAGKPAAAKGIGIHSPKGDLGKDVPADKAIAAADRMRETLEKDVEEHLLPALVFAVHEELNPDQDLYIAAQDLLKSSERNGWNKLVGIHKRSFAKRVKPNVF